MPRGGYRPGSGRPKGRRDSKPRRRTAPPPIEVTMEASFLAACAEMVRGGELFEYLRGFLKDGDPRVRMWAVDKIAAYGAGMPVGRTDQTRHDVDVGAMIQRAHNDLTLEQKREEEQRLLRAMGLVEVGATPPVPAPLAPPRALALISAPQEPVAPIRSEPSPPYRGPRPLKEQEIDRKLEELDKAHGT
jgi:hypothetical protein